MAFESKKHPMLLNNYLESWITLTKSDTLPKVGNLKKTPCMFGREKNIITILSNPKEYHQTIRPKRMVSNYQTKKMLPSYQTKKSYQTMKLTQAASNF